MIIQAFEDRVGREIYGDCQHRKLYPDGKCWRCLTQITEPFWGVMKLFDLGGKVVDATPYFGSGEVKFGKDYTPYLLASAALVTPHATIPIEMGWSWGTVQAEQNFEVRVHNFTLGES